MPGLVADENFSWHVVRQLRLRNPAWDVVTVQEAGLTGASDPTILEWAAEEGRILLTHDFRTIPPLLYERMGAGEVTSGAILASNALGVGKTVSDIERIIERTSDQEWRGRVVYLPLR